MKLVHRLTKYLCSTSSSSIGCRMWNMYGPAETTIACTYHLVDTSSSATNVPLGHRLPKYNCLLVDAFFQHVVIGQDGELFVGGVGVFAGYLGRDDLTANSLVEIDGQTFYQTGDLAQLDSVGILHYVGRKD